ncbi:transposase [Periweissella cryptocerci]|uniref:Transposase n=1 Tax=Periweissella cryptocerci TaxID=2506420 RepID=A0A4P6YTE2_9LACO|nr:DUF6429 family protein [Periweissella cryptocerci]QBO35923.1 transposase [Periweissella cryptocerci]
MKDTEKLTLMLMYLNGFKENDSRFRQTETDAVMQSWKGYEFGVLDGLDSAALIDQGSRRSKSAAISPAGVEQAKQLLAEYNLTDPWEADDNK